MPRKGPAAGEGAATQEAPPSAAVPPAKRQVGAQFNIVETRELLRLVALLKPIGAHGWAEVERQFNEKATAGVVSFKVREAKSLKGRFQRLAAVEKPTGEGKMPVLVREAKTINDEMHAMIDAGTLEDGDDMEEVCDSIEEALQEGPEPGAADSSDPVGEQPNDALLSCRAE